VSYGSTANDTGLLGHAAPAEDGGVTEAVFFVVVL
jgi:hypothetical protein